MKTLFTETELNSKELRQKTLTSFGMLLVILGVIFGGVVMLYYQPKASDNLQPVFRTTFVWNEAFLSRLYNPDKTARTYSKNDAEKKVRVNGSVGMGEDFDPAKWQLKIARKPGDTLQLSINDIKQLPKTEVIFDFKCVEGWNQVTHWGGVKFSEVLKKYNLASQANMNYVGMITPDETYYVGVDMPSMLQSQTILCYEMNGAPLPKIQGAPLRLIIPVKYGIKHLKRIGVIYFSQTKPKDYWAEQGYDYYSGL